MNEAIARFIRGSTAIGSPPLVPEIRLHLATEITPIWQASEEILERSGIAPPFWAFCWPGGQALARHVLDDPGIVAGRTVLDFAAGCGVLGIAAARAGARTVTACDIDETAMAACGLNAALNGVALDCVAGEMLDGAAGWDVILAGDVCYERAMTETVLAGLRRHAARGATVLVGDPGRAYLPESGLGLLGVYDVPTSRELEDSDIRSTSIWRLEG